MEIDEELSSRKFTIKEMKIEVEEDKLNINTDLKRAITLSLRERMKLKFDDEHFLSILKSIEKNPKQMHFSQSPLKSSKISSAPVSVWKPKTLKS